MPFVILPTNSASGGYDLTNSLRFNSASSDYLSRTQGAQSALAAQQANISAQQAIVDQKLSGQITEAYLNSPGYLKYQANLLTQEKRTEVLNAKEENRYTQSMGAIALAAKSAQLSIERMFSENWRSAIGGAIGAALATKLGSWIFGKSPVPVKVVGGDGLSDLVGNAGPKIGSTSRSALKYISKSPVLRTLYKGSKVLSKGMKYLGPIASVVGAGFDFMGRKDEGQSNLQAGAGVVGGLGGAYGGAQAGALLGSFVGPVGTLVGGAIGGAIGYWGGSSIADAITGAGKDPKVAAAASKIANSKVGGNAGTVGVPSTITLSGIKILYIISSLYLFIYPLTPLVCYMGNPYSNYNIFRASYSLFYPLHSSKVFL